MEGEVEVEEEGEVEGLEGVEEATFSALSKLLLRLPEHDNVGIYSSLITWANTNTPARTLVFYR